MYLIYLSELISKLEYYYIITILTQHRLYTMTVGTCCIRLKLKDTLTEIVQRGDVCQLSVPVLVFRIEKPVEKRKAP